MTIKDILITNIKITFIAFIGFIGQYFNENYEEQIRYYKVLLDKINSFKNEKNVTIIQDFNTDILSHIKIPEIRDELLNEYYDMLCDAGKKYFEYISTPDYIAKKVEEYKGIRIGLKPDITIGCEIEANNQVLYNRVNVKPYAHVTEEPTIGLGNEFTTPTFTDNEKSTPEFIALCETLKELGFTYDENMKLCGGHINIGLNHLDTADAILNFYELYGNVEQVLFHICNEENQLIRTNIEGVDESFFDPISAKLGKHTFNKEMTRSEIVNLFAKDVYGTSDMFNIKGKKASICIRDRNRLEFRMANGSTNYKTWIDNIRLFGRLVEVSKEIDDIIKNGAQNERDLEKIEMYNALKTKSVSLEDKNNLLMNLLFEDEEIKKIYIDRFNSVEKQLEITEDMNQEEANKVLVNKRLYRATSKSFGTVDFQRPYYTKKFELVKSQQAIKENFDDNKQSLNEVLEQMLQSEFKDKAIRSIIGLDEKSDGNLIQLKNHGIDTTHIDNRLSTPSEDIESDIQYAERCSTVASNIKKNIKDLEGCPDEFENELAIRLTNDIDQKVFELIKQSRISNIDGEIAALRSEKPSFIKKITGKEKLNNERVKNLSLRRELIELEVPDHGKNVSVEESLAMLYAYSKNELNGELTPEFVDFLSKIEQAEKSGLIVNEDAVKVLTESKLNNNKPSLAENKPRKIFHGREINEMTSENEKLQDEINTSKKASNQNIFEKWRGANKFRSISNVEQCCKRIDMEIIFLNEEVNQQPLIEQSQEI